jgi:hypothetical protein
MIEFIGKLLEEKRYPELVYFVRKLWDKEGWLYLKRNKNAVERVKCEFTRLTGKAPYTSMGDTTRWDQQIARYVDRLGVKAIIDDMQQAKLRYKPKSILYFIYSSGQMPCRWENLVLDQVEAEAERAKKEENEMASALAKYIGLPDLAVEPDWVLNAKIRKDEIARELLKPMNRERLMELTKEANLIQSRLANWEISQTRKRRLPVPPK